MSKSTRNSGRQWSDQEIRQLSQFAAQNIPTRVIGLKLGRTPAAIYKKALAESISLHPTNQSPYNRQK